MTDDLSTYQKRDLAALRGLTEAMSDTAKHFPDVSCPLLDRQVADLCKLSEAVAVMAGRLGRV